MCFTRLMMSLRPEILPNGIYNQLGITFNDNPVQFFYIDIIIASLTARHSTTRIEQSLICFPFAKMIVAYHPS